MATNEQALTGTLFPNHVPRPRLTRLLDATAAQVIVIVAPAGYGKTTLATEWTLDKNVTWYRPTRASSDIAAFALELAEAASAVAPGADARVRARLHSGDGRTPSARELAALLADDLAAWPDEGWLVIDDYHVVADSVFVEEFIDWLLDLTPLQIVVTSRVRPSWASARRLLYGHAYEIDRDQLAMTVAEAESVLGDRPVEAAHKLIRRADGWPALIGLAALVTHAELPEERVADALFRYVAEEVFEGQPPDVQQFMLLASVPFEINARYRELLDLDADAVVQRLVRNGLVQEYPAQAYRFHPLVRQFLRQRLRGEDAPFFLDLARRAAVAAHAAHRWEEAFVVAMEAEAPDLASAVLRDAVGELLDHGRIETVERWLALCDGDAAADCVRMAVAVRRGRFAQTQDLARRLTRLLPRGDPWLTEAWYQLGVAEEHLGDEHAALTAFFEARVTATTSAELVRILWSAVNAAARSGSNTTTRLLSELRTAATDVPHGRHLLASARAIVASYHEHDLSRLWREFELLLETSPRDRGRVRLLKAGAYVCLSSGRYPTARALLEEAMSIASELHLEPTHLHYCLPPLANVQIALRDFRNAERTLKQLVKVALTDRTGVFTGEWRNAVTRLYIARNDLERVLMVADSDPLVDATRMSRTEQAGLVAIAAAALGDRHRSEREARAARAAGCAIEGVYYGRFADVISALRSGRIDAPSVTSLVGDAIEKDFGDAIVIAYRAYPPLLEVAAEDARLRPLLRRLVYAANDAPIGRRAGLASATETMPSIGGLTKREDEVLRLVSEGFTNARIAGELFITESTVKLHVHHILGKLGVSTRTEAASAARKLKRT